MRNATRALQHARGVDARPGLEAEAIYQIARVHLHRGELDAARRLFRQSISLPGTPAAAWFYLGEALWNDNSPAARAASPKPSPNCETLSQPRADAGSSFHAPADAPCQ